MSQKPPQRPQRPQAPQQGQYPPQQGQYPPQQGQYPPQMPPAPYANYQQPLPPQPAPIAPQRGNPILTALKWIAFPFVKFFGWIFSLINLIIQEMLRSIVRFVFGLALIALSFALLAAYGYALWQTNFDFAGAFPVMLETIMALFGM